MRIPKLPAPAGSLPPRGRSHGRELVLPRALTQKQPIPSKAMRNIQHVTARAPLAGRVRRNDTIEESPSDREMSRLRGLSAEVGAACSTWLANRGIRSKYWGYFPLDYSGANRSGFDSDGDSPQ